MKGAGVAFGFGVFLSRSIDGRIGQTDDDASNGSQNTGGSRMPNPAAILLERDIQTMVQPAFDHPIAAFEREHPLSLELFQGQAAEEIDDFPAPFAASLNTRLQSGGQASSRKAHLAGGHFQALQTPNLETTAVVFAFECPRALGGPRGENPVW